MIGPGGQNEAEGKLKTGENNRKGWKGSKRKKGGGVPSCPSSGGEDRGIGGRAA